MAPPAKPLLRILRETLAGGSVRERRALGGIVVLWFAMVAIQVWDVAGRSGPAVTAELAGTIVLTLGTLLFALTSLLRSETRRPAIAPGDRQEMPREIVLVMPVLAGISATCLGFAGAMFLTRGLLGVSPVRMAIMSILVIGLVLMALQLVASSTRTLYEWAHDQADAAARAAAEADRARLAALQAQMNPHFLFNALNTIASLAATDGARAERTVEDLAGVLRRTLERSRRPLTTLDDEIAFVRHYLDVERARFGSRLNVEFDLGPDTGGVDVPTMSVQPLVENALKYAVSARLDGARIVVAARLAADELLVSVTDDGEGVPPGAAEGTGLGNLRARLRTLFGDRGRLTVSSGSTGTTVTIAVPKIGQRS